MGVLELCRAQTSPICIPPLKCHAWQKIMVSDTTWTQLCASVSPYFDRLLILETGWIFDLNIFPYNALHKQFIMSLCWNILWVHILMASVENRISVRRHLHTLHIHGGNKIINNRNFYCDIRVWYVMSIQKYTTCEVRQSSFVHCIEKYTKILKYKLIWTKLVYFLCVYSVYSILYTAPQSSYTYAW